MPTLDEIQQESWTPENSSVVRRIKRWIKFQFLKSKYQREQELSKQIEINLSDIKVEVRNAR